MSMTPPRDPDDVAIVTVAPPLVRLLPKASFNWIVMTEVLVPFATIEDVEAVIVDVAVDAAPGVIVRAGDVATDADPEVRVVDAVRTLFDPVLSIRSPL